MCSRANRWAVDYVRSAHNLPECLEQWGQVSDILRITWADELFLMFLHRGELLPFVEEKEVHLADNIYRKYRDEILCFMGFDVMEFIGEIKNVF